MLSCTDISFGYRGSPALFVDFSFEFGEGNTLLLGPNGAGKSTLLKLLASAMNPKRGAIVCSGTDSRTDRVSFRSKVGLLHQNVDRVNGITVKEQVAYSGWLKGMPSKLANARAGEVIDSLDLRDVAGRNASAVSGGQLRRVGIAQLLVHEPEVLLLDEPTAGLDPLQRKKFMELVRSFRGTRHTIISSHQIEDIDSVFDSVVVLNRATVLFHGSVDRFLSRSDEAASTPDSRAVSAYEQIVTAGA